MSKKMKQTDAAKITAKCINCKKTTEFIKTETGYECQECKENFILDKEKTTEKTWEDLTLQPDCEEIFDDESFQLCEEWDRIKLFPKRIREIEKKLKRKHPGKNFLIKETPKAGAEATHYYELCWRTSFEKAKKEVPPQPAKFKKVFNIQKGA